MTNELDKILNNLVGAPQHRKAGVIIDAKQAINAYILGEVMELVGEDENKKVVDWDCPCGTQHHLESDYYQRNQLRQELRNKANKKWGKL